MYAEAVSYMPMPSMISETCLGQASQTHYESEEMMLLWEPWPIIASPLCQSAVKLRHAPEGRGDKESLWLVVVVG